jgi:hypothetical protein
MSDAPGMTAFEIGTQFSLFFFAQAYGYAHGLRSAQQFTINEAVVFGARHLSHAFKPWSRTAWPLTPGICAALVLFFPHLRELQEKTPDVVSWFFAALLFVSVMGIGAAACDHTWAVRTFMRPLRWPKWPILFSTTYALLFVGELFLFRHAVEALNLPGTILGIESPWTEIFAYACFAWILFVTYLGSVFDGSVDRISDSAIRSPADVVPNPPRPSRRGVQR